MAGDERRRAASRSESDPLGRAMLDYQRDRLGTLTYRDGAETRDGHVYENYFSPPSEWAEETIAALERLAAHEPILDVGCGAGKHALWWQNRGYTGHDEDEREAERSTSGRGVDVTAVDVSPHAVRAARERGVEDARVDDMFDLSVDVDRFGAVNAFGTQLGLAGSLAGMADLLAEFARVTRDEGVAVVDNYDPTASDDEPFGYRPDPRDGIAHRCFHFEYVRERDGDGSTIADDGAAHATEIDIDDGEPTAGNAADEKSIRPSDEKSVRPSDGEPVREVGPTLHFLLCSPDRLRDATIGTPWRVADVYRSGSHYRAFLELAGA